MIGLGSDKNGRVCDHTQEPLNRRAHENDQNMRIIFIFENNENDFQDLRIMPRLLRRGGEPENARHFVKFISSFIFAAARSMILARGEVKISTRKWREPVYTQFA